MDNLLGTIAAGVKVKSVHLHQKIHRFKFTSVFPGRELRKQRAAARRRRGRVRDDHGRAQRSNRCFKGRPSSARNDRIRNAFARSNLWLRGGSTLARSSRLADLQHRRRVLLHPLFLQRRRSWSPALQKRRSFVLHFDKQAHEIAFSEKSHSRCAIAGAAAL